MAGGELGPSWLCCVPRISRPPQHGAEGGTAPRTGAGLARDTWGEGKMAHLNRTWHVPCHTRGHHHPVRAGIKLHPPAKIQPRWWQGFASRGAGEAAQPPSMGGG